MPIEFDFSELRGRIVTRFGNYSKFARTVGMGRGALSARLNNKIHFKPEDIYLFCRPDILDILPTEIGRYFFTPKV